MSENVHTSAGCTATHCERVHVGQRVVVFGESRDNAQYVGTVTHISGGPCGNIHVKFDAACELMPNYWSDDQWMDEAELELV